MAKAEKTKAKPKPKFTDKAQSERFIETARQLGVEETGEGFDLAFERIVKPAPNRQLGTDFGGKPVKP
jgi:hypothetical protein